MPARLNSMAEKEATTAELCRLVRSTRLYRTEMARLRDHYPAAFAQFSGAHTHYGLPIELVLDLAELARRLGLDSLPAPGQLLIRTLLVDDDSATSDRAQWRARRNAGWFFRHYHSRRSPVAIAHSDGRREPTVRLAITRVIKYYDPEPRRGRPRRHRYAH